MKIREKGFKRSVIGMVSCIVIISIAVTITGVFIRNINFKKTERRLQNQVQLKAEHDAIIPFGNYTQRKKELLRSSDRENSFSYTTMKVENGEYAQEVQQKTHSGSGKEKSSSYSKFIPFEIRYQLNRSFAGYKVSYILLTGIGICFIGCLLYGYYSFWKRDKVLAKLAYYDSLTGAYNLSKFKKECNDLLKNYNQYSIIKLDMKNFRMINSRFGKEKGNKILCEMSHILKVNTHEEECYCRDTADSFCLLLKGTNVSNRLQNILYQIESLSVMLNGEFRIQMRAGIIQCNKEVENNDYDTWMDSVIFALKEAKKGNKQILYYDKKLKAKEKIQNYIELYKERALLNGEIQIFLQPKILLESGEVGGAEALIRWIKDDGGMIYPDQFIPFFEQNGFCIQLDLYVLEKVCKKLREWMDNGKKVCPISVNQSRRLFYRSDYIETICHILKYYNISSKWIILEITEDSEIEDIEGMNRIIEQLHQRGFRVSMDDFGSGYSSLNMLGNVKIDELKFDRMFLIGLNREDNIRQKEIIKNMVSFAKTMNITVVIEGVETEEHEAFIKSLHCEYGQGYYYSKPISTKEFEETYLTEEYK